MTPGGLNRGKSKICTLCVRQEEGYHSYFYLTHSVLISRVQGKTSVKAKAVLLASANPHGDGDKGKRRLN